MVSLAGPLAMISCEPRQARKGATVIADSCAVVWLAGGTSNSRYDLASTPAFITALLNAQKPTKTSKTVTGIK
tara:strand:+ start:345 stop:563 length:219 start_codon:yes stop_codon:yes gene_type:complete